MRLTEEQFRALQTERTSPAGDDRSACPSRDVLMRAAASELTSDERGQVRSHVAGCSTCAREYRIAHALKLWTQQIDPSTGSSSTEPDRVKPAREWREFWDRVLWSPKWRVSAIAATLLVAFGISVTVWRAGRTDLNTQDMERGVHSEMLGIDPSNGSALKEPPRKFSWPAERSAEGYQVILYDQEATSVWESPRLSVSAVEIPEPIRQRLQRGRVYYWRIIFQEGVERRQSEVFQFVITE